MIIGHHIHHHREQWAPAKVPTKRLAMHISLPSPPVLYAVVIGYAVLAFAVGENGIIMIEVFGFGLPVLIWPLLEWVAPPLVAMTEGLRARESISSALRGIPLVLLFAIVTPTVKGKNVVIPAEVPWLAHHSFRDGIVSVLLERVLLWSAVFLVVLVAVLVLRRLKQATNTES